MISRRRFVSYVALCFTTALPTAPHAQDAPSSIVTVHWNLPPDLGGQAKPLMRNGLTFLETPRGERIAPAVVIAGAVAVAYLVRCVIEVYKEARYGGVIISVKGDEVNVANDSRLPGGVIIVRNRDNVQVLRTTREGEADVVAKIAELAARK